MPAERRFGMDHEHYDWSPLSTRGILRWPDDARLALSVVVALEHMEWLPPEGSFQAANLAGGSVPRAYPDYARVSHRSTGTGWAFSGCWTCWNGTAYAPRWLWTP